MGDEDDGVVRRDTDWGTAAIELVVEVDEIGAGERVSFQLVNRGEVELLTGLSFEVERWDGKAWTEVPPPENTVWPAIGIILPPGGQTEAQAWPTEDGQRAEPGLYRIVKSARAEDPDHREADVSLTARASFRVAE